MKVLSVFDGASCGRLALGRADIPIDKYYASEIDKYAMTIAQKNFNGTYQLGDVAYINNGTFKGVGIDLVMGGSPCQGFSFAGKQLNFNDPRSKLFFEFVRLLEDISPTYFLLENVMMKKEYQDVISDRLGCKPIMINSSLLSAQSRKRLYWTNFPFEMPEDKGILLKDILLPDDKVEYKGGTYTIHYSKSPNSNKPIQVGKANGINFNQVAAVYSPEGKAPTITTCGGGGREPKVACGSFRGRHLVDGVRKDGQGKTIQRLEVRNDDKTGTLTTVQKDNVIVKGNNYRRLMPVECERLQTLPDDYTKGVSMTQRYKMIGNGWTVDVIAHILRGLKSENKRH